MDEIAMGEKPNDELYRKVNQRGMNQKTVRVCR
jgi:hypothetical protein